MHTKQRKGGQAYKTAESQKVRQASWDTPRCVQFGLSPRISNKTDLQTSHDIPNSTYYMEQPFTMPFC